MALVRDRPRLPGDQDRERAMCRAGVRLLASALVVAGFVICGAAAAYAAQTLNVSPDSGVSAGEAVKVTGSGFAASTTGYLLECNDAPGQPTLKLGAPFDTPALGIGCSPPSLKHLVSTAANGSLSATFSILEGKYVGPPCGPYANVSGCSGFKKARATAEAYPCPPTPAQETAGVTCSLMFIDSAGDQASAQIVFSGGGPALPTTTTTIPKSTSTVPKSTTTVPKSTTTLPKTTSTVPKTTSTTAKTTVATLASSTSPTTSPATATASHVTSTTIAPKTASSSQLAFTGSGAPMRMLFVAGVALIILGLMLWIGLLRTSPRRTARAPLRR